MESTSVSSSSLNLDMANDLILDKENMDTQLSVQNTAKKRQKTTLNCIFTDNADEKKTADGFFRHYLC